MHWLFASAGQGIGASSSVLPIVNNATMNIGIHIFFQIGVLIFFR